MKFLPITGSRISQGPRTHHRRSHSCRSGHTAGKHAHFVCILRSTLEFYSDEGRTINLKQIIGIQSVNRNLCMNYPISDGNIAAIIKKRYSSVKKKKQEQIGTLSHFVFVNSYGTSLKQIPDGRAVSVWFNNRLNASSDWSNAQYTTPKNTNKIAIFLCKSMMIWYSNKCICRRNVV